MGETGREKDEKVNAYLLTSDASANKCGCCGSEALAGIPRLLISTHSILYGTSARHACIGWSFSRLNEVIGIIRIVYGTVGFKLPFPPYWLSFPRVKPRHTYRHIAKCLRLAFGLTSQSLGLIFRVLTPSDFESLVPLKVPEDLLPSLSISFESREASAIKGGL